MFFANRREDKKGKNSLVIITLLLVSTLVCSPAKAETHVNQNTLKEIKKISDVINLAKGEYTESAVNGKVTKSEEYHEANLFLEQAEKQLESVEKQFTNHDKKPFILVKTQVDLLYKQIKAKASPDVVEKQVKITDDALETFAGTSLKELPINAPLLDNGKKVFENNCASCHGIKGFGDGPASKGLNPPPVNFHDEEFVNTKSPYTFYRAVKNGITSTAMPSWEYQLSLQEKWDVINYVRHFNQSEATVKKGSELFNQYSANNELIKITDSGFSIDKTNEELVELLKNKKEFSGFNENDLLALVNYTREQKTKYRVTQPVLSKKDNFNETVRNIKNLMISSKDNYLKGDKNQAVNDAIASYMNFEPVERELGAKNKTLARQLELDFNSLKGLYATLGNEKEVDLKIQQISEELEKAGESLTSTKEGIALFLESMFLIMREGFEAIIIIAALLSFVKKASPDKKLIRNMYSGIGMGVVASIVTAVLLETALKSAKLSKEFLEGATVLFAAGILFYVSHWLVSKTQAQQWQKFIRSTLDTALSNKNQLAIVSVGFLSVYREGFETILFYKALYTTSGATDMITFGLLAGSVGLAIISTLLYKFSVKIPIKEFFLATGLLLYYMVFSFVGKGLHEFQEGNLLSITAVPGIPEIDLIGLYPTLETVSAQLIVLLLWIGAVIYSFNSKGNNKEKNIVKTTG